MKKMFSKWVTLLYHTRACGAMDNASEGFATLLEGVRRFWFFLRFCVLSPISPMLIFAWFLIECTKILGSGEPLERVWLRISSSGTSGGLTRQIPAEVPSIGTGWWLSNDEWLLQYLDDIYQEFFWPKRLVHLSQLLFLSFLPQTSEEILTHEMTAT